MDKKMFRIGYLVGVFLIIGIGIYGYFNMKSMVNEVTLNPISLSQLDLVNEMELKIDLKRQKPLVINYWATWCVPCVQEFPEFEELHKKYAGKVDFVMVSDEEMVKIEKFKAKKKYTLQMVRSNKTLDQYGIMARPATYFYNAKGELISKISGKLSKKDIEDGINSIL